MQPVCRARQCHVRGDAPDGGLAQTGVGQRAQYLVLGGRTGAGPIGTGCVIGVLAVRHRVQPLACDDFVVDPAEQLVLAVEATIRAVGDIGSPFTLVRGYFDHGNTDRPATW